MRAVTPDDGCYRSFSVLAYAVVLLAVLLTVTELQILTDGVMRIIDLLAATAGLEVDLDADIVNRYSL